MDFGAHRDQVPQEVVDGLSGAVVRELKQVGVGLDDGLDEPLDLFGPRVKQLVLEDLGLLDDGEGVVGGAGTRVRLCRWTAQPQPRGKEGHPGWQTVFWGLVCTPLGIRKLRT